jgi:hypothetical protein
MLIFHSLTHNTSPHKYHELLISLAWVLLCSLTLFMEISDAISTKISLIYEELVRQTMEWQFAEQTIDNIISMVADQQMLDNAHTVNGKGTVVVHGVSSRPSCDQQQMLLPTVSH